MAVSRWDPFRDLMSIQGELNQLFGRAFGSESEAARGASWAPVLDVFEDKDRFVIVIELAGLGPDDVEISVEEGTLAVSGERKFYESMDEAGFHRVERRFGTFARSLSLPSTADVSRIEAGFEAGLLTITVPKKEEARPRKIQVKATA
jgi:HSP20 family protein